jgi:hypothetical protein
MIHLDGINQLFCYLPRSIKIKIHMLIERVIHYREGNLYYINLTLFCEIKGSEWLAHPISEPYTGIISKGSVVQESCIA